MKFSSFFVTTYREKKRQKWLLLFSEVTCLAVAFSLRHAYPWLFWLLVGLMPLQWVSWYYFSYLPLKRGLQPLPEDSALERAHWKRTFIIAAVGLVFVFLITLALSRWRG